MIHDDVIKWKSFLCYWPFVRGIPDHRWIPRTQRPETRGFVVFFDLHQNKRLSKQWWDAIAPIITSLYWYSHQKYFSDVFWLTHEAVTLAAFCRQHFILIFLHALYHIPIQILFPMIHYLSNGDLHYFRKYGIFGVLISSAYAQYVVIFFYGRIMSRPSLSRTLLLIIVSMYCTGFTSGCPWFVNRSAIYVALIFENMSAAVVPW